MIFPATITGGYVTFRTQLCKITIFKFEKNNYFYVPNFFNGYVATLW